MSFFRPFKEYVLWLSAQVQDNGDVYSVDAPPVIVNPQRQGTRRRQRRPHHPPPAINVRHRRSLSALSLRMLFTCFRSS